MTYEYNTALGAPQGDQQPAAQSWNDPEVRAEVDADTQAFAASETRAMTQSLENQIAAVRSGEPGALDRLQETVNHHDYREMLGVQEDHPGMTSDGLELLRAMTLASAVAEGNDPRDRQRVIIGVSVGAVVVSGLLYALLKR